MEAVVVCFSVCCLNLGALTRYVLYPGFVFRCLHKITESDSQFLIRMAFWQQHWLRERAFILRYTHVVSIDTGMTRLVALH